MYNVSKHIASLSEGGQEFMRIHSFYDVDTVHVDGDEVDFHSATLTLSSSGPNRQGWTVEFLRADLNDCTKVRHPVRITMVVNGEVMSGIGIPDSTSSFLGIGHLQEGSDLALAG